MTRVRSGKRYWLTALCAALLVLSVGGLALAVEEHGGEAAHGDSSAKLVDLLYRAICFAIVFAVLFFLLRKPLPKFLADRRAAIKNELESLEEKKAETQRMLGELRTRLGEIEQEREKIVSQYVKEGEAERAKIIEQARLAGQRIEEQARYTIDQEIKKAKLGLQSEIADLATSMAEDVIRKNLRNEDDQRLIDEYLEKVVKTA